MRELTNCEIAEVSGSGRNTLSSRKNVFRQRLENAKNTMITMSSGSEPAVGGVGDIIINGEPGGGELTIVGGMNGVSNIS